MDDAQRQAVMQQAAALLERQAQEDDPEILPKVTLADVPKDLPRLPYREREIAGRPVTTYETGTNGLIYQQLSCSLPEMSDAELRLLPHLTGMAAELGLGAQDYLATQERQSASVGALSLFTSMRGAVNSEQQLHASLVLSSKALARKADEQADLMRDTLLSLRFDELPRIRDLVSQQRARREQSITGHGHSLAMTAACAGMSPLGHLHHELSGLRGISALRRLDEQLRQDDAVAEFAAGLSALYQRLREADWEALLVADPDCSEALAESACSRWQDIAVSAPQPLRLAQRRETVRECWVVNTQVNFCAKAYPTVPSGHPDAAALTVLAGYLRNGYLHRAIREQGGAYGGGASHDASLAAFRFYSYRDPRLGETLEDFDASLRWLRESRPSPDALEEAILGVIGAIDRPGSPAGEAKQDFHNRRFGRDHDQRMAFRNAILGVSLDDLQRVAATYLQPEQASIAVLTSGAIRAREQALLDELSLEMRQL
jgi:Zn-dependent M16 (insulinase) family peptidase